MMCEVPWDDDVVSGSKCSYSCMGSVAHLTTQCAGRSWARSEAQRKIKTKRCGAHVCHCFKGARLMSMGYREALLEV
jgi:hypothetical protein